MHIEILVEDSSGKLVLDHLLPKLVVAPHSFSVHSYRGVGRLPKDLRTTADPTQRILLDQLPRILRGFGRTFLGQSGSYNSVVVVVCDLDRKCKKEFREELLILLESCNPKPPTKFCIAIEEMEAWFLADPAALRNAYQRVNETALSAFQPDSIVGTWEVLADVVYPGGSTKLRKRPFYEIGAQKHSWAERIAPHLNVDNQRSPSFVYFIAAIRALAA